MLNLIFLHTYPFCSWSGDRLTLRVARESAAASTLLCMYDNLIKYYQLIQANNDCYVADIDKNFCYALIAGGCEQGLGLGGIRVSKQTIGIGWGTQAELDKQ